MPSSFDPRGGVLAPDENRPISANTLSTGSWTALERPAISANAVSKAASIRIAVADCRFKMADRFDRILTKQSDFEVITRSTSLVALVTAVGMHRPDIAMVDPGELSLPHIELAPLFSIIGSNTKLIVLTTEANEIELLHAVPLGVHGIVPSEMALNLLPVCIRAVNAGDIWMERTVGADTFMRLHQGLQRLRHLKRHVSRREIQIIWLAAEGKGDKEIARKLSIAERTVKIHLGRIFHMLGIKHRAELKSYAPKLAENA